MDFKGITWVGNVYQKFEAMCLEVEEIIVQDTAKYVENQVQTVGNSVKKFYSDVVQDLLPDDNSIDSAKPLPLSMLHDYAPVCSFAKKREIINRRNTKDVQKEQVTKDAEWVVRGEGKKDGCALESRGLDADDYDICTSPRLCTYGGPYRRTRLGRKQNLRNEEVFQVTRPRVQRDSALSMVYNNRVEHLQPSNDVETVRSSDSSAEAERLISRMECLKDNKIENEDVLTVVNSVRSQDSDIQPSLPVESDDFTKEDNEESVNMSSSSVSKQKAEILQQFNGRSIEESCILVDRNEFHCVLPEKDKPYKIRDVISSRMRRHREGEYKRLARQWYAEDVENGEEECGDSSKELGMAENQSQVCNGGEESDEWELL